MRRALLPIALAACPAAAAAGPLTVTRTMTVVSDGVSALNPRILPGSILEYSIRVENPALNPGIFTNVKICDAVPVTVTMRVADIAAAGRGPVEFVDGGLAGLGSSGLAYGYTALAAPDDGLVFENAAGEVLTPVSAGGLDANVRRVCVTLTGTRMTTGGSFRLRYRVRVN